MEEDQAWGPRVCGLLPSRTILWFPLFFFLFEPGVAVEISFGPPLSPFAFTADGRRGDFLSLQCSKPNPPFPLVGVLPPPEFSDKTKRPAGGFFPFFSPLQVDGGRMCFIVF